MSDIDPIKILFDLKPEDVAAQAMSIENSMKSLDLSSEKAQKKLVDYLKKLQSNSIPTGEAVANVTKRTGQLGNSINQITRELPAFTFSAQTGFMAISNNIPMLADSIARLRVENQKLIASGQKGTSIWKQLGSAALSFNTLMSVGITLMTVYGKEIGQWVIELIKSGKGISALKAKVTSLNTAFKSTSYKKTIQEITALRNNIELAKKGLFKKSTVVKQYNKILGKTTGTVSNLNEVEKGMITNADKYIKMTFYKATANAALEESVKKTIEAEKRLNSGKSILGLDKDLPFLAKFKNLLSIIPGSSLKYNERTQLAKNRIKAAEKIKEDGKTFDKIYKEFIDKTNKLATELNIDLFDPKSTKNSVNNYDKLLKQIADLDQEYSRKKLSKDNQELQALKDKFSKVRKLIQDFNTNKANKVKIDVSKLDTIQKSAESTLKYRQATTVLQREVANQEKIYQAFENAKTVIGEDAAKKRYENKLKNNKSYRELLQTELAKINPKDRTGVEQERFEMLNNKLTAYNTKQKELYNKQLNDLQSYQIKRKVLIENFNATYTKLLKDGKQQEAGVLKSNHQNELDDLDDANTKKLASYKAVFNKIKSLTRKETKLLLDQARTLLDAQIMSSKLKEKILQQIAELEQSLNNKNLDLTSTIVKNIGELGVALEDLGGVIGSDEVSSLGGLFSGLASNIDNVLVAFDSSASATDKISAGVSSLVSLMNVFTSSAAQRKQVAADYYSAVMGYQKDYNLSLNNQILLQSKLAESVFMKNQVGRMKDGLKALRTTDKEYAKSMQSLSRGKAKNGTKEVVDWSNVGKGAVAGAGTGAAIGSLVPVIGTAIGFLVGGLIGAATTSIAAKKTVTVYTNLLKKHKNLVKDVGNGQKRINVQLAESLIKNNLVDKATKKILENVLAQEKAHKKAMEQVRGVVKELAGRMGGDLQKALVTAFKDGENAALKMGDTVGGVLEDIISQLIFNQIFSKAFKDLEQEMTDSQDLGGDGSWVDDFGRFMEQSKQLTDDYNSAMKQAQKEGKKNGFDLFKNKKDITNSQSSLQGAVKGITEQQADLLAGQFGGLRLTQLDTNRIIEASSTKQLADLSESIAIQRQIELNTKRTAENTELLKPIDKTLRAIKDNKNNNAKGNGI